MHTSTRLAPLAGLPILLGALLGGCAESDTTTGPGGPAPAGPPVIRQFSVSSESVLHGDWTQLSWKIEGAQNASITPDVGLLQTLATGAKSVRPIEDVTYTLTAFNDYGSIAETISVAVGYRAGVYVNPAGGDDANSGSSPHEAIATLGEAFARTAGGGALFLAAGTYDDNLLIDGPRRLIYGGLNPATFLQEDAYQSVIRPSAGTPLVIRGGSSAGDPTVLDHLALDARFGGAYALSVDGTNVLIQDCLFDGTTCGSGTAVLLAADADVTMLRSRVRGGGDAPGAARPVDATGVRIQDSARLLARDCFLSGGYGLTTSAGVDVDTDGTVLLGFNTISAAIPGTGDFATPIRIRRGRPAIGGNILLTRGAGRRPCVIEETADADPSWFQANLIVTGGSPVYDNYSGDGADPVNEAGLNNYQLVTGEVNTVGDNLFPTGLAPIHMFEDVDHFDYHLVNPLATGGANPAVNTMPRVFDGSLYGIAPTARPSDIDAQTRPSTYREMDRGADEL
jgi:hypothetical protein